MEQWARGVALATALVAWAGLALQLSIIVERMAAEGLGAALWRFFGYFTLLTNLMVAVVAGAMALAPESRLAGPRARLAALASILLVGLLYTMLLRHIWSPTGWQKVADHALHDAAPLLFLLAWILARHGGLAWRDALWALVPGALYVAYALARGAADGWYAYWFLNPQSLGWGRLALSLALLAPAFLLAGIILVGLDRKLARPG